MLTVLTRSQDGAVKTYSLRLGARSDEDQSYVASSSESPYYVRVADYAVKNFVEDTRDSFIQLPPTPTPEPAAEPTP